MKQANCNFRYLNVWSRYSSVQKATRLWARNQLDHGYIPGRGKTCLFSKASSPVLGPTQSPIQWLARDISHGQSMKLSLTHSSTKIRIEWSCTHSYYSHLHSTQGFYFLVSFYDIWIFRHETRRR